LTTPPARSSWLRAFWPAALGIDRRERWRVVLGAAFGVALTAWLCHRVGGGAGPWLIAPMGASAVLVFGVPSSPMAQPWAVVAGNTVSALVGVACARWLGPPELAAAVAVGAAIALMFALRCLHPPGGAVALFAVIGGDKVHALGYEYLLVPVLGNALLLLAAALIVNNLLPGRHYPRLLPQELERGPDEEAEPRDRFGLRRQDLHAALRSYGHLVDVGNEELDEIVEQAERLAFRRTFGELACADIMSHAPITVRSDTSLLEAWRVLRRHRLVMLLVVDSLNSIEGVLGLEDFVRAAKAEVLRGLRQRLFRLLRLNFARHSAVGSIMRREVLIVPAGAHVAELVEPMSRGIHQAAVVDAERRLLGVVTQSDLVAALFQSRLATA